MRRPLFIAVIAILTISLSTCSDNATSPDNGGEETTTYTVTVDANEGGSVTPSGENTYDEGEEIELQADPNDNHVFTDWSGDIESTVNPFSLTIYQDYSITANFEVASYSISVETSGDGTVTITPDQEEYEYGTEVELQAEPNNSDWEFETWDGDTTSTNNPITISVDSSITITGKFANTLFAGGVGTEDNPYQISTVEQLQAINQYLDAHYEQINDIDASETIEWYSGKGFKPIGNIDNRFTGAINGNGFTITNLYIERINEDRVGLLGIIDEAKISNMSLKNFDISGQRSVGGLIGSTYENPPSSTEILNNKISGSVFGERSDVGGLIGSFTAGTISNSISTGNVDGNDSVGGLIGTSSGNEIINSYSESSVNGSLFTGGLIGENYGTLIKHSYATGNVQGSRGSGGLIGINHTEGRIINSYSTGKVTRVLSSSISADEIGGLVGNNEGEIKDSQAFGDVSSTGIEIGGLVGINSGKIFNSLAEGNVTTEDNTAGGLVGNNQGIIENSTSIGNVSSDINSGGFAGKNSGEISNSYSLGESDANKNVGGFIGKISAEGEISNCYSTGLVQGSENIGGLVGLNEEVSNITNCYWDLDTSDQNEGVGFGNTSDTKGLTTSEMTGSSAESNMTDLNWDEIWITTDSYPALFWEE